MLMRDREVQREDAHGKRGPPQRKERRDGYRHARAHHPHLHRAEVRDKWPDVGSRLGIDKGDDREEREAQKGRAACRHLVATGSWTSSMWSRRKLRRPRVPDPRTRRGSAVFGGHRAQSLRPASRSSAAGVSSAKERGGGAWALEYFPELEQGKRARSRAGRWVRH